jgi:hypothetical protein
LDDEYQDQASEESYSIFVFAMNAPQTREKYTTRVDRFFDSSIFREIPYRNAAKLSLKLQGMIIFGL